MMQIDPQARTTPAVRAEIARSTEPASVVAKRCISDEAVRKWRKRGEQACQDRSSRPSGCHGGQVKRSVRSSARCGARQAFRLMT